MPKKALLDIVCYYLLLISPSRPIQGVPKAEIVLVKARMSKVYLILDGFQNARMSGYLDKGCFFTHPGRS